MFRALKKNTTKQILEKNTQGYPSTWNNGVGSEEFRLKKRPPGRCELLILGSVRLGISPFSAKVLGVSTSTLRILAGIAFQRAAAWWRSKISTCHRWMNHMKQIKHWMISWMTSWLVKGRKEWMNEWTNERMVEWMNCHIANSTSLSREIRPLAWDMPGPWN